MHPDFAPLIQSWQLALKADGYAKSTVTSYEAGLTSLAKWLHRENPETGPTDLTRNDIRGWLVHLRETVSPNSARSWYGGGVRHFCHWMVEEGEIATDPTAGIRTPSAGDTATPTLRDEQVMAILATCKGNTFIERRDSAILFVFFDGGLRLAELTDLRVGDFDIQDRMLFVHGKGTNRSGPRRRATQLGIKAARALDRYLRERRKHPYHEKPEMWLGGGNRGPIGKAAVKKMVMRRAQLAGVTGFHPHVARHTWASEFRKAGGEEGDLMVLGGWRSRQMLDRYGRAAADERAQASYRQRSFGDRL